MAYTKKDYCENTVGSPPYGVCKQDKYHHSELHVDHVDGNPSNNDNSNLQTICSNCHERKTHFMGDHKTKGRGNVTQNPQTFSQIVEFLVDIFNSDAYDELRRSTRRKYFIKPFKKAYGNDLVNCLQGATGFGKTYGLFVEAAPYHFSQGGRVHIALSPMKDSQGYDEIRKYVNKLAEYEKNEHRPTLYHSDLPGGINWTRVKGDLANGENVTIVMSDQYFNNEDYIQLATEIVGEYNTLITRDEASYGMLSSWELSKQNNGHKYPPTAKSAYYNNFMKLHNAGAHATFGITATPTREMQDLMFGAEWNMANEIPNSNELIVFRKWHRNLTLADWSHDDYGDKTIMPTELNKIFTSVDSEQLKIDEFNEKYECGHIKREKITALIVAQTDQGSREKIRPNDIVEFLNTSDSKMPSNHTLITATAEGWKEYDSTGKEINSGDGEEYQDKLNSSDEKAHYLVVMNKAVYGVNINTLGFQLWFRQYQNENEDGESITNSAQQGLGRMNRVNFSIEKIVDLAKNHGPHAVYEYFLIAGIGCFDVKAPKSQHFETAFSNFKENHGTHIMDALGYLFQY